MIIINNTIYDNAPIDISFKNFDGVISGKKYVGKTLLVEYDCDDFKLSLETGISKEKLQELVVEEKTNITSEIIDIQYEDSQGLKSLGMERYTCYITKNDDDNYYLEFILTSENYNIQISEIINI